ncbi:hypothetical protein SERLA73DRAFT_50961, partial [Serpula lacrymans var. lacrymans S7.3]
MSGSWAWKQADKIAEDPQTHGSMLVPVILGSDKTTVSVATRQNKYYPLYLSIGNIHNNVRCAHKNGVVLVGCLAIPKTDKKYSNNDKFCKFRRQLFHTSLAFILQDIWPGMTSPKVARCPDQHLRRVILGLGPYIADYPEQALPARIVQGWCPRCTALPTNLDGEGKRRSEEHIEALVNCLDLGVLWDEYGIVGDLVSFTNDFPRADINELLAPDLLHQFIKGTFKDHLVTWVEEYITQNYSSTRANEILDDIDQRIASAPYFSGLRRFPQGHGFKQWTGDESKALMKVYLPAIEGHVPPDIVRTLCAFLEFYYLVRRDVHDTNTLAKIQDTLSKFHRYQTIFQNLGVRPTRFSLPRQHSMTHYYRLIQVFGAPNGLCSSITESKHIQAVKKPWCRSSKNKALGQMLLINQRLDKLAASRISFTSRGMLSGTVLSDTYIQAGLLAYISLVNPTELGYAQHTAQLGHQINQPDLPNLIRRFLFDQIHLDNVNAPSSHDIPLLLCPYSDGQVSVFHSTTAYYYAPCDPSGISCM